MIGPIEQWLGVWWPSDDTDARGVITRDCQPDIQRLMEHVNGRDVIVQAGANVGLYPIALADLFQEVHTCEPDETNYTCLKRNLAARDALGRVRAQNAAYGAEIGLCEPVEVKAGNCGAHRVAFNAGIIPVVTIDSLGLTACDCIYLDVEGSELLALKGAAKTIEAFGPTICVEDKGLNRAFGIGPDELQSWLAERGYRQVGAWGRDKVFRRV